MTIERERNHPMVNDEQRNLERECADVYAEVDKFWQARKGKFPTWELGYAIFFSPPRHRPDLVLLGHNPSAYPNTPYPQSYNPLWPACNEIASETYRLATKIQCLFGSINALDALDKGVHMNLNFFRSRPASAIEPGLRWKDNPLFIRKELEQISMKFTVQLLNLMQPKLVVATGMGVFNRLAGQGSDIIPRRGNFRRCVRGMAGVHPVIGVPHPTGAHVSTEDWTQIMRAIRDAL